MNELQIFNFNKQEVRTLLINNEPYFVGKDVADVLGYQNGSRDINRHVDDEDKLTYQISASGQKRTLLMINESGLYSLILSSKMPNAKKFKRWVTSEVLPAIRKTGSYQIPTNPMEALKLMFDAQTQTNERLDTVSKDVKELKENKLLDPGEYNYLSHAVRNRVRTIKEVKKLILNQKQNNKIYSSINHDLNSYIGVKTRTQIRQKDFNKAVDFVSGWEPSYTDMKLIEQLALEI